MIILSPSYCRVWLFYRYCVTACAILLSIVAGVSTRAFAETAPATAASGYHLDATWKIGGDGGWDYLTVDPDAHRLYVTRTDRVQVIDTEKGSLVGEVPGLEGGHGTALALEFNRGFATSGRNGMVVVFDLTTLKPVGEPVAVGKKPDAIIYEPLTKHVFAFNGDTNDASVIDASTAKVIATIPLGGGPEFAVSDGKGMLFVNLEDKSETLAIDVQKNTVASRWPLAPGDAPTGLALDPAKRRLYAGCHNEQMIVLDADSGKIVGKVAIGKGVDACAFDPSTGFAFASCGEGTMTVAKEEPAGDFHLVESVKTHQGARTMAFDSQTHAVYLASAEFETAPSGSRGRPKMVPGTFAILKFVR